MEGNNLKKVAEIPLNSNIKTKLQPWISKAESYMVQVTDSTLS